MVKELIPFAFAAFLSLQFGCASESGNSTTAFENDATAVPESKLAGSDQVSSVAETPEVIDRKLIKTGQVTFETDDPTAARLRCDRAVQAAKGYISNENSFKTYDRHTHSLEVRIPSEKFDQVLTEISKGVEFFDNKSISLSDVSEQFIDLETRLKTKKELETRYLVLLAQAKTVQEILEIERQAAVLREEIEVVEGRLKYLSDQVGMSTLSIEYYVQIRDMPGFGGRLGKGLSDGWQHLLSFLVLAANLWPFAVLAVIFFLWLRRRARKKKASTT